MIEISKVQIVVIVTVLMLSTVLMILFNKTRWGIAMRSVSQNREAAALVGIDVRKAAMVGNCIGCAMAGVAGVLIGIYYQSITPNLGSSLSMKAFAAATLGGLTSVPLSAVGGEILGLIENIGISISSASFRDVFSFGFLIVILIVKPTGFTKRRGNRP
jgi:branched-chain amino acid transport system permease protein